METKEMILENVLNEVNYSAFIEAAEKAGYDPEFVLSLLKK